MKKIFWIVLTLLPLLMFCGSKREKAISEAKQIMNEMKSAVNKAAETIEKTQDSKEAAKALEALVATMQQLKLKSEELDKKYPELKVQDDQTPPELKAEMESFNQALAKLMSVLQADPKKMNSPEFLAAMQKLSNL